MILHAPLQRCEIMLPERVPVPASSRFQISLFNITQHQLVKL